MDLMFFEVWKKKAIERMALFTPSPGPILLNKWASPVHRLIGKVFGAVGVDYMGDLFTTFANKIGYPYKPGQRQWWLSWEGLTVLWHEGQHIRDGYGTATGMRWWRRILFPIGYAFPQCLSPVLLVAAALLGSWWLLVASLVAVAPIPAPFRWWLEMRAFGVNLAMDCAAGEWEGLDEKQILDLYDHEAGITGDLAGWQYYCAMPAWVTRRALRRTIRQVLTGRVSSYQRKAQLFVLDAQTAERERVMAEGWEK